MGQEGWTMIEDTRSHAVPFTQSGGVIGGWTRLWIALSVPWVLFFGTFGLMGAANDLIWPFTVVPPMLLYATGLTVRWIARGFLENSPR
jgi:hypothetical protein